MENVTAKSIEQRKPEDVQYAKEMAIRGYDEHRATLRAAAQKAKAYRDSLSYAEREEYDKTLQAPSTRATLERDPSLDAEWRSRPLPPETIAASKKLMEAKTDEERGSLVNERKLDPGQVQIIEAHRRNSKNTAGQSELSATGQERRNMASEAFLFTPPAVLTPEEKLS